MNFEVCFFQMIALIFLYKITYFNQLTIYRFVIDIIHFSERIRNFWTTLYFTRIRILGQFALVFTNNGILDCFVRSFFKISNIIFLMQFDELYINKTKKEKKMLPQLWFVSTWYRHVNSSPYFKFVSSMMRALIWAEYV